MSLHQLQKLNPRHFKILDLVLDGYKAKEIADALDMSLPGVGVILNSPSFQHELALRRNVINERKNEELATGKNDPVLEKLKASALQAANRLAHNVENGSGSVSNRAAAEILDRTGFVGVQKHEVSNKSVVLSIDVKDVACINETLRMLRSAS